MAGMRRWMPGTPVPAGNVSTVENSAGMSEPAARISGWEVIENHPAQERHRVLLTPGLFCSAAFFAELLEEGSLDAAGVKALATTPPGFGGNRAPHRFDYSIENYAALYEAFAAEQSVDLIVGHSFSANVCIEIAARERFTGPVMLLSPSLQAQDEEEDLRQLYEAGRKPVVGSLVWLWLPTSFQKSFKGKLPDEHYDELIAEMRRNPRHASRQQVDAFFAHLRRYDGIADRLAGVHSRTWLVRGDRDPIQDSGEEVELLEAAPAVERKTVADAGHFSITDNPAGVNSLIVQMLSDGNPR
jgi:pimeloyl-ACP methyl ester carboxylesterase